MFRTELFGMIRTVTIGILVASTTNPATDEFQAEPVPRVWRALLQKLRRSEKRTSNRPRKNSVDAQNAVGIFPMAPTSQESQDAQKGRPARPQQAKRRGGTTRTLCGRSPLEWILANGEYPLVLPSL